MSKPDLETAVEEIMEIRDDLCNEWEWVFIGSVQEVLDTGNKISEKQKEIIWKLYKRACESNL